MSTPPLLGSHPVPWSGYADRAGTAWQELLSRSAEEREAQRFLEHNPAFLPIGDNLPHAGVVFTQPRLQGLGARQYPDFLWIDGSSQRWTPVLVEIEKPSKAWFTRAGALTAQFHRAHQQLGDWQAWFLEPENQLVFRRTYIDWLGTPNVGPVVPRYVLVYGRDEEFAHDPGGVRAGRRVVTARPGETLLTYDHLTANPAGSNLVTVHLDTLGRLRVRAIAPTLVPGPHLDVLAARAETPASAVRALPGWDEDHKAHLVALWRDRAATGASHPARPGHLP